MSESLPVRLNRDRLHDIETRASFETTDSFAVMVHNGDAPVHVHLHLDDALSAVASIPANNHFVDADSTRQVGVEVEEGGPRPVEGQLKIVTGHGAETDYVSVTIAEPEEEEPVAVDETLAERSATPGDADDEEDAGFEFPTAALRQNGPVAVLGLLALAVAAGSASLADGVAVFAGSLAVLGSLVAAGYLLAR
ncbi:hypothetical protein M0R88_15290 [Halorussus gelatinilyticus]|uniref:Uncharacterized protein n=1 Tax=Halorussus gelatinilyticus TaxID=2937524 RepID=A0A8U0IGR4_9EURY|nr:hypothetical protein [Halorussus gelatinilyticus]UPV99870.1 hypothetical protein M0R88_15290 [Halorussus gelatinilyticus]